MPNSKTTTKFSAFFVYSIIILMAFIYSLVYFSDELHEEKVKVQNCLEANKLLLESNKPIINELKQIALDATLENVKTRSKLAEKTLEYAELKVKNNSATKIKAIITAYNTTPEQTEGDPCEAKFGNVCGRTDTVACPREIPAHNKVIIGFKEYECMDWTAERFDGRFDINFDKDIQGAKNFGVRYMDVYILK